MCCGSATRWLRWGPSPVPALANPSHATSLNPLLRFKLYLWADNDEVGRDHMERIGKRLLELGASNVHRIKWQAPREHDDAADFNGDVGALVEKAEWFVPGNIAPSPAANVWSQAVSAPVFIGQGDQDSSCTVSRIAAPGSITMVSGTRGLGKTNIGIALAVPWASGGTFLGEKLKPARVLLLNRDNPTRVIRRRLQAWGGAIAPNLFVLGRDKAPPFTDKKAWEQFPLDSYDAVIVDSLSAFIEGVDEKEGGATGRAIASPLDAAAKGNVAIMFCQYRRRGKASWQRGPRRPR